MDTCRDHHLIVLVIGSEHFALSIEASPLLNCVTDTVKNGDRDRYWDRHRDEKPSRNIHFLSREHMLHGCQGTPLAACRHCPLGVLQGQRCKHPVPPENDDP